MEHIVYRHLMKFLESNEIQGDYQHGFRIRRFCETRLNTTIRDLAVGLERRQQVDAFCLDFSKALDKISHHHRLAVKLHYSTRKKNLSWIRSFLPQVFLDGKTSSAAVTAGVPQGTVLGLLLFLVCIHQ